jgi:hypothetical protein
MADLTVRFRTSATAQQCCNSRATVAETTVANTPLQQCCNSTPATACNSPATAIKRGATVAQQNGATSATAPYRGGKTVAPLSARERIPLSPALRCVALGSFASRSQSPRQITTAAIVCRTIHERGWERPHHPLMRVDNQRRAFPMIAARTPRRLAARVTRAIADLDHTNTAARTNTHQRTRQAAYPSPPCAQDRRSASLTAGRTARSCVFASFHAVLWRPMPIWEDHGKPVEGIYARALSRPLTVLDRVRREREPGEQPGRQRRNVRSPRNAWDDPDHLSKPRGGGGDSAAHRYIDILPDFRGPVSENLGGPVLKISDRPVKSPALTQGSVRIRQIGSATISVAFGAEPAPAAISESRAYRHV